LPDPACQAIWRKEDPRWIICGIPEVLYTDHGSDFTSRHLEQVSADLKMQLVFSIAGKPKGPGRIERFFRTVKDMFLCELPGYAPADGGVRGKPKLRKTGTPNIFSFFLSTLHPFAIRYVEKRRTMTLPRSQYVQDGQEGIFHCFNRCVRRAFLCGFDSVTGRNFSHRKEWLHDRLRFLTDIFAIEVCAFAILANHFHTILRTRPDIVARWSDWEVAGRWLTLCPKRHRKKAKSLSSLEEDIRALATNPELIAKLRRRLSSVSWFMAKLDEFIARAANKEDGVKGRFWESRFKCQALLDESAICSCMIYVDLNPIRAALADTPEDSDFTSIQERIYAWQNEGMQTFSNIKSTDHNLHANSACGNPVPLSTPEPSVVSPASNSTEPWLCPISSDSNNRGILSVTTTEYFDLVDKSGRMIKSGKRGTIDSDLAPILLRIGVNPDAWFETISHFGSIFHVAAGLISNLRTFADRIGRKWLTGVSTARYAFASSQAQIT
jgi:hypothetical protein